MKSSYSGFPEGLPIMLEPSGPNFAPHPKESIYRREFALFNKLDQSRKKIIITNDEVDFSTTTVTHMRLKDFLEGAEL